MILKRFYDTKLAQASYLIGCAATGESIVIDPNRDIEQYLTTAAAEGLKITHVSETHIHADFVSGSRELAQQSGAQLLLSDEGDADWKYAFAGDSGAKLLHDGDAFMVGNIKLEVMHTPGHTPEHISFIVTDTPATSEKMAAVTGDFLFVGDVGRPDLLEKAAHMAGTMEAGARTLFQSLQRFKKLPDHLQIWPGHGAGSACGKALGAMPSSTLGYEKLVNWGLAMENESAFVQAVLSGQPDPPKYFAEMKRVNKEGPPILGARTQPVLIETQRLKGLLDDNATVIDIRPADAYAAGHVHGTINIPLNKSFLTWAGWLVPYDKPFYLVGADQASVNEAARDLSMIGLDDIAGYFDSGTLTSSEAKGLRAETIGNISPELLAERLARGEVTVLDVRNRAEWEGAHISGAINVPVGVLPDRLDEVPRDKPVVVHCQTGGRSAIAASVLQKNGITDVLNLSGGITGWQMADNPVERETADNGRGYGAGAHASTAGAH